MPQEECLDLVKYIQNDCHHLSFAGLMTIGKMSHEPGLPTPNPDFIV